MEPAAATPAVPPASRRWIPVLAAFLLVALAVFYFFTRPGETSPERESALQLAQAGQWEQALPALRACAASDPNDAEVLRQLCMGLIQTGVQDAEVDSFLEQWAHASPKDPEPLRLRLALLKGSSRQREAAETGERLLSLTPNDDLSRHELLLLYYEMGRFEDARRECLRLEDSTAVSPEVVSVSRARVELALKNLPAARRAVDELLRRLPGESMPQILLGLVHLESGENTQAIEVFRKIKPRDRRERISILHSLGLAETRAGRADEAHRTYAELARVTDADLWMTDAAQRKSDPFFQMRAARALVEIGDYADAGMILDEMHTRLAPTRESWLLIARCHEQLGRPEDARAARERAALLPETAKP